MAFKALSILLYLLLSADAAHAGPVAGAVAAIGSFFATGIGSVVARVAVGFGFSLLQKALTGKTKTAAAGQVLEIKMGEDQPMSFIIGSRAVGGRRKYIGTWGSDGSTPNAYLTDVIELANLPSYAGSQGLNSIWIDDKKCTVDWSKPHADGRGYPVTEFRKSGKDYLWIKYYDGTQTAADSFLVAKFGGNTDRPYGSDRIGRGVQYIILTARYNSDLFSGMPAGIYEPKPTPFYDPRKDSTNGGSGAHRWNDPATYEATLNPITAAYNIARGIYYDGDWFYGGQNVSAHRLPNASWFAAANECDRTVNDAPQFRCGLEVTLDTEPLDVLEDLRIACAGRFAEVGGFIKPLVGAPGSAVYSFDDDGIVITKDQDFEPFPSLKSTHNRVTGTYPEPAEKWATKDAPENRNLTLEAEDGNRSLPVSVSFVAVPYSAQVQSLIETMVKEQRRFRTHVVTLPPLAAALEPNDVVAWTSARNAYSNKKFLVTGNTGQSGMLRQVALTEIDPSDYDPPETIVAPVIGWTGPVAAPVQAMTGFQVSAGSVTDSASQQRRPAIVISCASDLDDVARVWVKVRVKATGVIVLDSDANPYGAPASWTLSGSWCLALTEYEVQGKLVPVSTRQTEASAWISVTTLNLSESSDVLDGSIVSSKIADAAVTASKIMDEAVTNLKLADQAVTTAKLAVAAVTQEILASGSVIADKLADAAVTGAKLAAQAVDATKFAASIEPVRVVTALPTSRVSAYVTFNGEAYRWNGASYVKTVATAELTGQLIGSQIADLAIVASKIADGIIIGSKIAADTIGANNLAVGSVTAKQLVVMDFTNLVPNGDFTSSDLSVIWNINKGLSNDNVYYVAGASRSGAQALILQKNTLSAHDLSISLKSAFFVEVEVGQTYTYDLSFYTNLAASTGGFWFRILYYDSNKSALTDSLIASNLPILTTRTRILGQVTMPANTRFVGFEIYNSKDNTTTANLLIDYLAFRRSNAAELIVDGSILANMLSAGSVTTDKLAANSVIAGKIAAGAVNTDQLVAGAVTTAKVAAGAISTNLLAVGQGANFIKNSDFSAGLTGWTTESTNGAASFGVISLRTDTYAPTPGALQIQQINGNQGLEYGVIYRKDGVNIDVVSVEAGKWYELSTYYFGHRCNGLMMYICFADKNGTAIAYVQSALFPANQNTDPGKQLSNYQRAWFKVQAPAGSVYAFPFFRHKGTVNGQADSYLWIHKPFFGEATANQTEPTPWSAAGVTLIQNGNIVAGAVTADSLAVNSIVAGKIVAGAITTPAIAAGAVIGASIAASTITGTNIAADTIGVNNLAAGSVTAKALTLTDYTNLVPNGNFASADLSAIWDINKGLSDDMVYFVPGMSSTGGQALLLQKVSYGTAHDLSISLKAGYLIPVEGGQTYAFDVSYWSNSGTASGGFWFRMIYYNESKQYLNGYADLAANQPILGTRTRIKGRVGMPSSVRYIALQIFSNGSNATTSNLLIDYIAFRRANAAELIVDGAITANQLSVNSLSAITANLGTVTAGEIRSSNGKMIISLNAGTILITD